jgi:predicted aconitase with swiveling domain
MMTGEPRSLVHGRASGELLVLDEPLSFWGGLDPHTGEIVDRRHPQSGRHVNGVVLAMPAGRGSSSSSSVFVEAVRAGTAPAAIVLAHPDTIVALGALVAAELYGTSVPVVTDAGYTALSSGQWVTVVGEPAGVSISRRDRPDAGR